MTAEELRKFASETKTGHENTQAWLKIYCEIAAQLSETNVILRAMLTRSH